MRAETKERYPDNWREISQATIEARGGKCEDCGARSGYSFKVLTVHHIDYDPANNDPANLVVLCQGCHLRRQARDLSEATRLNKVVVLLRMGQLVFPGMELEIPKRLDRVLSGKALATSPRTEYHAPLDTWPAVELTGRAGRG